MCGIAGFCNYKQNFLSNRLHIQTILNKMHNSIAHRGNDYHGTYYGKNIALSHARLSIRDVKNGNQPMAVTRNGFETVICYNGEIYNTNELIPELKTAGYIFKTTSDTEVILYAFMHFGPDFVTKLNGIFSFAIWQSSQRKLYLYRDRIGIKPLFYACKNNSFIFGSEPKALFCHPDLTPKIDTTSIQELLSIGPARTPGYGIFRNVYEVKPGHYLEISQKTIKQTKYWDLTNNEHCDNYSQTKEKIRNLLTDAIEKQLVSDVPICTFLSGGLDSSIVTAVAYKKLLNKNKTLNTYSFDFKDNDNFFSPNSFQPEQDKPFIKIMLNEYLTKHSFLECNEINLFNSLFSAVDARDYPGMADIDASLLYFCSKVAPKNKVALTGECSDEIFGGYPWFYRNEFININDFPWSHNFKSRTLFLKDDWIKKLDLPTYSHEKYLSSLNSIEKLSSAPPSEQRHRQLTNLCIKWFMQTLLDRMDRTSMYSSLEARVPFADHRLIEYVYNVPWSMKYHNQIEKSLLRDSFMDILPPILIQRKKSPYPKTYHPGYERLLYDQIIKIVQNPSSPINPLIDINKLERFLESPTQYGTPWFGQLMAGPQLIAYFIQLNYWMTKYNFEL